VSLFRNSFAIVEFAVEMLQFAEQLFAGRYVVSNETKRIGELG